MFVKLIDRVKQDGPIDFIFLSRSAKLTAESKTTGDPYDYYNYTFKTRADGREHKEKIFTNAHDWWLCTAVEGDICRVSINQKKPDYVQWEVIKERGEAAISKALPTSNGSQIQAEKKYTAERDEVETERLVYDYKLGLAGIVQAMLIAGHDGVKIREDAPTWVTWIRNKAEDMASTK